jgi:hypothetical protein
MNKLWKLEAKNTDIFSAELFARNIKFYLKITELTVLDKKKYIYIGFNPGGPFTFPLNWVWKNQRRKKFAGL